MHVLSRQMAKEKTEELFKKRQNNMSAEEVPFKKLPPVDGKAPTLPSEKFMS